MNKYNLKVGQIIYVDHDYSRGAGPTEYEVTKVGRKWAELKYANSRYASVRGRIDINTLEWDGRGASVWLSLEERTQAKLLLDAWDSFRRKVMDAHRRPPKATLEIIMEARALLGL